MMTAEEKDGLRQELDSLRRQLDDPKIYQRDDYPQLARRLKELAEIVGLLDKQTLLKKQRDETVKLTDNVDQNLAALAKTELEQIDEELVTTAGRLAAILKPATDEDFSKNCFVEIRAGVGGGEAALFAGDLCRMYLRFSEKNRWKTELVSQNPSEAGGYREIILKISGKDAYRSLRFESGVHRVQRIPTTESQGRIHTSTASVAVLPIAEKKELEISPSDLKVDTYRSSGHGGQSVNKTDSAVRITHAPSGLVVTCQDEKSQFKNKEKALEVLRSRLLRHQQEEQEEATSSRRQKLIGRAFRNEKIRTYNFPQDRLTDHRVNLSLGNLASILSGDLSPLLSRLGAHAEQENNDA